MTVPSHARLLPLRALAGALLLSVLLSACGGGTSSTAIVPPNASSAPAKAPPPLAAAPAIVSGLPDFTALVEHFGPAVVNVTTVGALSPTGDEGAEDPFSDFFHRFGIPGPRGQQFAPQRGEGSGFILSPDGYILTNAHVVADAAEVTVRLTDRREFPAKVIGVDRQTDVAVLKIAAKDLPVVQIGDPGKIRVGEWVVAIGSPFGFENSVTAGIVSGTARVLPDGAYTPFIQTDVAVNPGNSGGPLFDMSGRVIGINSQIYSRTGGYMGVSFAIPIDVAINVKDQLVKTGKVQRGRIGVVIQDVNQQLADSFGLDRPRGALVSSVEAEGPGEKAGVKPGDVILAVDGTAIDRSTQLPSAIAALAPGSKATLEIWRERASRRLVVTVGQLQDERVAASESPGAAKGHLGLSLRPLTPAESRAAGVSGLLVEDVAGAALAAGVQQGDVLIGVNGQRVTTVDQMRDIVAKSGKSVALLISRDGQQLFLPVRPG